MGNIVFIGGIHGVGKTTFCKSFMKEIDKHCRWYSVSDLIKKYKKSDEEFIHKKVKNIDDNQKLFLDGLKEERGNADILLDGHFVLIDGHGNIRQIGLETYREMQMKAILLLVDRPENIKQRLNHRSPDNIFASDFLEAMQEQEIEWAYKVAELLHLPIKKIDLDQCKKYEDCLTESIKFISAYIND